ncbi:MAG: chromate transporter, partial [Clostridia bacterium]|nr:chromate transporter [Clostridia bacterium]
MIYLELFLTFFKIGAFTFGGGYAMLPLVQEAVLSNRWLGLEEVINFIAVSESTPGPFAINMATYVGNVMGG